MYVNGRIPCSSGLCGEFCLVSRCQWGNLCAAPLRVSIPPLGMWTSPSYSSSFWNFVQDRRLLLPHPGHKGVVTSGPICLFTCHACVIAFPISVPRHPDPCAQPDPHEAMCVGSPSSHFCGESLAPSPPGYPHSPLSIPGEI